MEEVKLEDIPVCACGCGECPPFSRGGFAKWVKGHKSHEHRAKKYIEEHGIPLCHCGAPVRFIRGIPNRFCSRRCQGKVQGYSLPEVQQKIRENFMENHDGMLWSQTPEGREVSRRNGKKRAGAELSEDHKTKIGENSAGRWKDPEYRSRCEANIKISCNSPKEIKRRTLWMKENSLIYNMKNTRNFLSKWHLKMREVLELEELGFVSEKWIEGSKVDEVNEDSKVIVEFNGDYWHCNPDKYSADFIVWSGKTPYTAAEKWEQDRKRKEKLELAGYRVIYIWESDTLEEIRNKIIF